MGNNLETNSSNGYRIVQIAPHSPTKETGLVEFLDFIIGIEDLGSKISFSDNFESFFSSIQEHENKVIILSIYNILTRKTRKVPIIPNRTWKDADSLLGIVVRYEDFSSAHKRVLKVINVKPNSQATLHGLEANNDYILGTASKQRPKFLEQTLADSASSTIEIFIYNEPRRTVWSAVLDVPPDLPLESYEKGTFLGCEFAAEGDNVLPYHPHKEVSLDLKKDMKEDINEFKESIEVGIQMKPPTDKEIKQNKSLTLNDLSLSKGQRSYSVDLLNDVLNQRTKAKYKRNNRKGSSLRISKPFTDSGISSISKLNYTKTLGNLDEIQESLSPERAQSFPNLDNLDDLSQEKVHKQRSYENSMQTLDAASTRDNLDHLDSNRTYEQTERQSVLSLENPLERKSVEGLEKTYTYFSKRKGGDYMIRSSDLFNIQEIKKTILC